VKVKAKRLGFYGNKRRREGDSFFLKSDKDFSDKWMVKESKASKKPAPRKPEKPASVDNNKDVI